MTSLDCFCTKKGYAALWPEWVHDLTFSTKAHERKETVQKQNSVNSEEQQKLEPQGHLKDRSTGSLVMEALKS